jgi:MFS family permease
LTEIVSWGVLYYAFPVLSSTITADTGWSSTSITAIFSAALVVAGATGIAVGRAMHAHGPRWLMTGGSVVAVCSVLLIASARSLWLYAAGWLAGAAMSCVLYAPAFAAVTVWFGPRRVRALTAITLVAGLASTVFAPLTALLNEHLSWRGVYLVLAVVLGVVTIPAHLVGLRPAWHRHEPGSRVVVEPGAEPAGLHEPQHDVESRPVRRSEFWLLAAAFTAAAVCFYATVINLVPLLHERGYSGPAASWVLGIGGIGQVVGRLGNAALARRTRLATRTVAVFAAGAVTTALFAAVPAPYVLLVAVSLLASNARGLSTLLAATAVSDRWGVARYARLNGMFNAPMMAGRPRSRRSSARVWPTRAVRAWHGRVTVDQQSGYLSARHARRCRHLRPCPKGGDRPSR